MLTVALEILRSAGAALALCLLAGWGAARLALPPALRPLSAPLAPVVGCALLMWAGYTAATFGLSLRQALPPILVAGGLLCGMAWRLTGRPRPLAALREHWPAVAVALLALLAGVLPLLQYGFLTTVGRGWDTESYLPAAQLLADYPVARFGDAPASPLRDLVRYPPQVALSLGFPALHAMAMLLSGETAIDTFAPTLAVLRALAALAAYAWLRGAMGLGRWAASLAAALAAAGSLMLWVAFFNFGMQTASWPLVPLGLAVGLAAVDDMAARGRRAWPSLLLAALCLAALPVAYYPALTVFAPVAAGLGLARALELGWRPRELGRLALAAAALGAAALLLAAPTVRDYYAGFDFLYSLVRQAAGPGRFVAAADILGLTAFRLEGGGDQPPLPLVWAAGAACAALALAAAALPGEREPGGARHRLRWALALLPLAGYMAWLRFGRPYEYAYMKTGAYLGAPLWGALLLGWQRLAGRIPARARRPAAAILAAIPLAAAGWSQALVLAEHGRSPALFGRDLVAVEGPAAQIPAGAPVLVSASERLVGPANGLIAAALYGRPIWGRVATGYASASLWPAGGTPSYALLTAAEPPWPLDVGASEVWRSRDLALFRMDPAARLLTGRSEAYRPDPPAAPFSPSTMAAWRRAGPLATASPGAPLRLLVGDDLRLGAGEPAGARGRQRLRLRLASLGPRALTLRGPGLERTVEVPAGVSAVELAVDAPAAVTLEADGELALIDATARPDDSAAPGEPAVTPDPRAVAWRAAAARRGDTVEVTLATASPGRHALRAELTVVEDTFDGARRLARTLAAAPPGAEWLLRYAPARGATEWRLGGQALPLLQADALPQAPDGDYLGVLTLYAGEEPVGRAPLFTMAVRGGQLADLRPLPASYEASAAGPPARGAPATADVRTLLEAPLALDGRPAQIEQVALARQPAWPGAPADAPLAPGDRITARVYWRAGAGGQAPLAVSLQLLGPDDRKIAQWDGPAGGEWDPAPAWAAGDGVRQDVPLTVDPAAPPGTYRLLLVAYDPATGAAQPVAGQGAVLLGEVVVR